MGPAELPPPGAQALRGDAQPLGHPPGGYAALPLRDRRPLERFIVGAMRGPGLRLDFFAAHGVDLPSPRAAVYFIRAISANAAASWRAAWVGGGGWNDAVPGTDRPFAASRVRPPVLSGALAAAAKGSPFFCVHFLQHPDLEQAVGEHLLELPVLPLQLAVPAGIL